jgi:hypothetical protein
MGPEEEIRCVRMRSFVDVLLPFGMPRFKEAAERHAGNCRLRLGPQITERLPKPLTTYRLAPVWMLL